MVRAALGSICRRAGRRLLNAPTADWIEEQLLEEFARMCNDFASGREVPREELVAEARRVIAEAEREPSRAVGGSAARGDGARTTATPFADAEREGEDAKSLVGQGSSAMERGGFSSARA